MLEATKQKMTAQVWAEVLRLLRIKIGPSYELKNLDIDDPKNPGQRIPGPTFLRLVTLADVVSPNLSADAGEWVESMFSELKRHLLDRPAIFHWEPGKEPPMVKKYAAPQTPRIAGGVSDALEAESMGKEDADQKKREQENERLKNACEHAISSFYPVKYGQLSYSTQQEAQKTLRKYLAEQTERGANMAQVLQKIEAYIENEYQKLAPAERLGERR